MPVEVFEKFESRKSTKANQASQSSAELGYIVRGTDNDIAARDAAQANSPSTYDTLPRQSIQIEPIGPQLWDVAVRYSQDSTSGTSTPSEASFNFETGGGTQHITQSLQTVQRRPAPGTTAPDFGGAIGVTADGVEGVDITVPVYQFSETHYFSNVQVTASYKGAIFSCTGKTNAGAFKGFAPGEVLFLGASGSKRGDGSGVGGGDWEITFRFAASPNQTGLSVGSITGISKKGWEYLWVRYADAEDTGSGAIIKKPIAAYVERVYDAANFGALGI